VKFRCTYCGKPHERNDPPCDNCGHSEFEKAVVPMAPEADDDAATTYVWVCTECGNDHPKNTPPCDRCGSGPLERREQTFDEEAVVSEMLDETNGDRSPSADVGYLDVLDAKLVLGFVGVGALVVVLALGFLGVVTVPGITPPGPVPGNATTANGISLSEVGTAYVAGLNDRRTAEGGDELTRDEQLRDAATYINQERVRATYDNGDGPAGDRVRSELGDACGDVTPSLVQFSTASPLGEGSADTTATDFAEELLAAPDAPDPTIAAERGLTGVDVHVGPDGRVFVAQLVC
jgi:hypothetical protein